MREICSLEVLEPDQPSDFPTACGQKPDFQVFLCGSSTQTRFALLPLLCTDRLTRSEEAELGAALLYENNTTGSTLTEIAQWIFPRSSEQLDCHIIIFYSISVFKLSTGSILRRVAVPCVISTLGLFNQPLLSASLSCY